MKKIHIKILVSFIISCSRLLSMELLPDFGEQATAQKAAKAAHTFYHELNNKKAQNVRYPNNLLAREEPYKAPSWRIEVVSINNIFDSSKSMVIRKEKNILMSKALENFIQGPSIADCWIVSIMAQLHAFKAIMGQENFDRFFTLYQKALGEELISFWQEGSLEQSFGPLSKVIKVEEGEDARDRKGSFTYFHNCKKYPKKHVYGLFSGEYVACIGKTPNTNIPVFMGFGAAFKKSKNKDAMNKHFFEAFNEPLSVREKKLYDEFNRALHEENFKKFANLDYFIQKIKQEKEKEILSFSFDGSAIKEFFLKLNPEDNSTYILKDEKELYEIFKESAQAQKSIVIL